MPASTPEPIEFSSDGLTLRGFLYSPPAVQPVPAIVMSHGWGATLRMGLEPYAERFRDAGFAVLLYDNPNIGLSDGEPRFEINPWVRARATRDAVGFAAGHELIDATRIAVWGDSGDAARVFLNAATDDRIAALISYNPTFGAEVPATEPDLSVVARIHDVMHAERLPEEIEATYGPALVVSADPEQETMSPSPSAFRWFFEYGGRHGSGWENRWSFARNATGVPFRPYDCLPAVTVPVLMVVGRDDEVESCNPDATRHAFRHIAGPASWHDVDGGHFGALYSGSREFEDAVTAQTRFLTAVFAPAASTDD